MLVDVLVLKRGGTLRVLASPSRHRFENAEEAFRNFFPLSVRGFFRPFCRRGRSGIPRLASSHHRGHVSLQ